MLFLARYARKISVLIRGTAPTWSRYLEVAIRADPRIELRFDAELTEIRGDAAVAAVATDSRTGEATTIPAAAVFVFIGQQPQSEFVRDLVLCTEEGHILTGLELVREGKRPAGWGLPRDPLLLETSVPGIFAAGDVRNGTKHGVAAATGDGNAAVSSFWQYLSTS